MAPSPENDNTPKAPDKSDTNKCEKPCTIDNVKEKDKDEKTLSNLNDGELKALLDEAINYKNPKDREGKSKLFKDLLTQAEETERIARATSAGGSESARHYNTSARHQRRALGGGDHHRAHASHANAHGRHQRHRKPASISENVVQGGSLDNLAKEEMFLESTQGLVGRMKSVSARQREGGSLPCDVNSSASVVPTRDYQFLEEARRNKAMKDKEYTAIDIESSMETQRLLDHDSLAQNYQEHQEMTILPRYTTNATLQISATPVDVDDPISLELDNAADKKPYDLDTLQTKVLHSKYSVYIPTYRSTEERKVDENGNALHQNPATKAKKKKTQTDKNVVVLTAERVEGHRSDIINDVDKLIQYIKGGDAGTVGKGGRSSNVHKSKQLHKQHASEDGPSSRKKQRANSTKGKESRPELKKSNSLGEISTATLDDFAFVGSSGSEKDSEGKVVLRHKSQGDRPKERRSWGNVEPPPFQILSSNASTENLETTDNWVVTKPKKKSKKRRNSVSSGRRPTSSSESNANRADRAPSPDLRSKSARSVPHSERSNDSSDADSVHSLPIDGLNAPISYADIAKNSEKAKEKKTTPEKPKEKSPSWDKSAAASEKQQVSNPRTQLDASKSLPPDFNDAKSFPAIPIDSAKSPSSFPAIPADSVKSPASFPAIPVDSAKSPASFPAIPVDSVKSPASFPAIVSEGDSGNPKNLFPDVNSIRSFPAITNNSKGCVVEKTNVRNVSVSGKSRNVSPGNKSGGKAADGDVKFGGTNNAGAVNSSIQNDLTIIHSNEKDSIQFNAQMLPPNIPDVQTIEKMHFLNCPPPQQQRPPPPDPPATTPLNAHAAVSSLPAHTAASPAAAHTAASPAAAHTAASPVPAHTVSLSAGDLVDSDAGSNCDSVERTIEDRPPPVVILSGQGSKEATVGLVFGFDVNEQLLKEDICENFVARYVAPPAFDSSTLNHDKIVNFIGSAWEAIVNQSNGKVQYYKEKP